MYALDALFGLPRKRAAGVSHRPALHENLFFCNQESVDEFVTEENDMKQSFQVVTLHTCAQSYACVSTYRIAIIFLLGTCYEVQQDIRH